MNREILFRGKRVDNGEWIEGNLLTYPSGDARIAVTVSGHKNPAIYGSLEFVTPETVGQYTGLDTDIKSTPIYKDDIIKFDNGNVCFIGKVDKECGAWGIVADNIPLECQSDNFISFFEIMWDLGNSDMILDDIVPYVEVIGNIHENPELLEVAE